MSDATGLPDLTAAGNLRALAEDLRAWIPRQRWFPGKARTVTDVEVADVVVLDADLADVLVDVTYADGPAERYQVPLRSVSDDADQPVARLGGVALTDATEDPGACWTMAHIALSGDRRRASSGAVLLGQPVTGGIGLVEPVRKLKVEQSNTSVVFGGRLIFKVFRRLEPGENPDVELTRALTRQGFRNVPAQHAALELHPADGATTALGVLADFIGGAREGWDLAVEEVAGLTEGAPTPLLDSAGDLGAAVGGMHVALREAFGDEPADAQVLHGWRDRMRADAVRVLDLARQRAPEDAAAVLTRRDELLERFDRVADVDVAVPLTRIHGDLHLGQVLIDPSGTWRLLDFEGEPARGLEERRRRYAPLRDVAGMLRSFDYACGPEPSTETAGWRDEARGRFLAGYMAVAEPAGLLPGPTDGPVAAADVLLAAFELDKAVYELGYELANRPHWVPIPVAGIGRVLDALTGKTRGGETAARQTAQTAHGRTGAPADTTPPTAANPAASPATRSGGSTMAAARSRPSNASETPEAQSSTPTTARTAATAVSDDGWRASTQEITELVEGRHRDPHRLLGVHPLKDAEVGGAVVRVYRPDAESVRILVGDAAVEAERTHDAGFFEARLDTVPAASDYRLQVTYPGGAQFHLYDAYAFWPTIGEIDLHLAGEGRHEELWRRMGAHERVNDGVNGTSFAVWAPNARSVRVIGQFNSWDGRLNPMRMLGGSGIWELFIPEVGGGDLYKFEIITAQSHRVERADPYAFWSETPPGRASRIFSSHYDWGDQEWMRKRRESSAHDAPVSIYEVHLGSWRYRDGRPLTYREMAEDLAGHVEYMGFTHVELLPPAEHPFGGSWGYQVTGYYAPTARFGTPDDFRYMVDTLHQRGIGVLVDWVPAHFPKDEWALANFDGTALYEHADPRQGEHPDWGTLVFNFGRNEVRNFLIANALYWLEELHIDGLRVDAVASMLYLDYSREEGQWVPNRFGGRENLEAVDFLRELNSVVYGRNPDVMMVAEESTSWPGVSRPAHLGGLGFGFKWNMGWMHDSLSYMSKDPVYRRFHHNELTFAMMYAWSENFILPLSHDEVVHGKRSLIDKMPGDRWQKFANLRAFYGYMWAHPGKQLLFMGSEFGQWREWSEQRELDWYLLDELDHRALQRMVADLNARYRELEALWQLDVDPDGFEWIDANAGDENVIAFLRKGRRAEDGAEPRRLVCITNFAPVPRTEYRVGLPGGGTWKEVLNTDATDYGGGNVGNMGVVEADETGWHGRPWSARVVLPPLGTVWLAPAD